MFCYTGDASCEAISDESANLRYCSELQEIRQCYRNEDDCDGFHNCGGVSTDESSCDSSGKGM